MPDLVVWVPVEIEQLLQPKTQRDTRVRIGSAGDADERVQGDQYVDQVREWKATIRRHKKRSGNEDRRDLE
jgi:hypothetical protein